ncbi:TM234 protein, partial [Ramphastos sulfuratus]|nr:TM234 protein [Ramphastos sulfuratus]
AGVPLGPSLRPGCGTGEAAALVLVAVLWGSTGPFLRTGAAGLEELRCQGRLRQLLAEIRFLGLNYKVRSRLGLACAGLRLTPS